MVTALLKPVNLHDTALRDRYIFQEGMFGEGGLSISLSLFEPSSLDTTTDFVADPQPGTLLFTIIMMFISIPFACFFSHPPLAQKGWQFLRYRQRG